MSEANERPKPAARLPTQETKKPLTAMDHVVVCYNIVFTTLEAWAQNAVKVERVNIAEVTEMSGLLTQVEEMQAVASINPGFLTDAGLFTSILKGRAENASGKKYPVSLQPPNDYVQAEHYDQATLAKQLAAIRHDVGNPLAAVRGMLETNSKANQRDAEEALGYALESIQTLAELLAGMREADPNNPSIDIASLHKVIRTSVSLPSLRITVGKLIKAEFHSLSVPLPRTLALRLGINIAQNTSKALEGIQANARSFSMTSMLVSADQLSGVRAGRLPHLLAGSATHLVLVFQDNGHGYPQDMLENGFITGTSGFARQGKEGNGIGMAGLRDDLQRAHSANELLPTNRTDGTKGAQTIVITPLLYG